MPSFFASLFDIQQHASFVKRRYSLECVHCKKIGHLIAHGNVVKQVSMVHAEIVGKRFVCCKRFGHVCLLASMSVVSAYTYATGQMNTRHAWRWLAALKANVWCYRSKVNRLARTGLTSPLLDVLTRCLPDCPAAVCLDFQLSHQIAFI